MGSARRPGGQRALRPERALAAVAERLARAGCVAAEEEAEELLAARPDPAQLESWLRRREAGEPLAWITGTTTFCDRPLRVDAGVYVPRWQTEDLARRAAAHLPPGGRAADLCTGAGAVAAHLHAAQPGATVVGVDVDPLAVRCARRNGVRALVGDLGGPLRAAVFDVVTAVAPYVPTAALRLLPADVQRYEPRRALDGGDDGLAVVGAVAADAARLLRPGGVALLEVGGDQGAPAQALLEQQGFVDVQAWHDDDGDLRGITARRPGLER